MEASLQSSGFLSKARPRGASIVAAIMKTIEKLREEGGKGEGRGEKAYFVLPLLYFDPSTSPLGSFFDSPQLFVCFNVQIVHSSKYACRLLDGEKHCVTPTAAAAKETKCDVTCDNSQRRFLAQQSVAMLQQCCNHSKQCHNNVASLCSAKNRCCESSRVTSP